MVFWRSVRCWGSCTIPDAIWKIAKERMLFYGPSWPTNWKRFGSWRTSSVPVRWSRPLHPDRASTERTGCRWARDFWTNGPLLSTRTTPVILWPDSLPKCLRSTTWRPHLNFMRVTFKPSSVRTFFSFYCIVIDLCVLIVLNNFFNFIFLVYSSDYEAVQNLLFGRNEERKTQNPHCRFGERVYWKYSRFNCHTCVHSLKNIFFFVACTVRREFLRI